jgi:phosphonate transport system substrate-binding protein
MTKPIYRILLLLLCFTSPLAAQNAAAPQTVTFGIVPQQAASALARAWTPILQYLGKRTGLDLQFKTAPNIPEFEQRVAAGEYDIAYMNPYHYTVFHQAPGYQAFAKEKDKRIQGIIVVRKDSPYQSLEELNDRMLAFPSPAAFAASVLPRAQMAQEGIRFTPKYVSSHDSVYLSVSRDLYPGGGGIMRTFNNIDPKVRDQLRILWKTRQYTPHAFAAHPGLDQASVDALARAMIVMADDPAGQKLLKGIGFAGIEAATDADWDDVRGLGITLLDELIKRP